MTMNFLRFLGMLLLAVALVARADTQIDRDTICSEGTPKVNASESAQAGPLRPKGPCPETPRLCFKDKFYVFMHGEVVEKRVPTECDNEGRAKREVSYVNASDVTLSPSEYMLCSLVGVGLLAVALIVLLVIDLINICKSAKEVKWVEIEKLMEELAIATSGNDREIETASDKTTGQKLTFVVVQRALLALTDRILFGVGLKQKKAREVLAPPSGEPGSHSIDMSESDNDVIAELEDIEGMFGPSCNLAFKDGMEGEPGAVFVV